MKSLRQFFGESTTGTFSGSAPRTFSQSSLPSGVVSDIINSTSQYSKIPENRIPLKENHLEIYVGDEGRKTRVLVYFKYKLVQDQLKKYDDPFILDDEGYDSFDDYKDAIEDKYRRRPYMFFIK